MGFKVHTQKLKEALSLASRFCLSKLSSIPSLQGGLLYVGTRDLEIITTNLNDFFSTSIPIKRDGEELTGVVDVKKIVEFLSFINDEKIELSVEGNQLIIKAVKIQGTFGFLSSQDFPQLPKTEGVKTTLSPKFIKEKLKLVTFAAAKDETRPVLTGTHFTQKENIGYIVSTDGFRLSLISDKTITLQTITLSAQVLEEVLKITEDKPINMYVSDEEKIVRFVVGDKEIYTRIIEGDFPAFERVLPSQHKTRIILDRDELSRNIKLVSVFARDTSNTIVFKISKKGLTIHPRTIQSDSVVVEQPVEGFEGEDKKIAFNYRFVVDFLNNTESKTIIFEAVESTSPGVFKLDNNEEFIHIIMPIRIEEEVS